MLREPFATPATPQRLALDPTMPCYAAQALLRNSNVRVKKHSAVVAKFGEHFAKTGTIDPIHHETLIKAKKRREIADYDVLAEIDAEKSNETIAWARDFLGEVKTLLAAAKPKS